MEEKENLEREGDRARSQKETKEQVERKKDTGCLVNKKTGLEE